MKKTAIVITVVACLTGAACWGQLVLAVADEAVVQEQSPSLPVPVKDVLRTASEPQGAAEKIYLKFDASAQSGISDILQFEGFALRTKYPRSASVFLVTGNDAADWSQSTLTWDNAPANDAGRALSKDRAVKVGTLPAPPEKNSETVAMEWESNDAKKMVIEALNSGKRCITLIVIRPSNKNSQFASLKNMDRDAHPFRLIINP